MQELVREYLNELGRKQRKRRRIGAIVAAFVIIVAGGVIWSLIQSGIAMTGEAKCGIDEHAHGEECYTNVPVCGQEESEGHKHTEDCYKTVQSLVCGQEESEEHTHTEDCYQTENVLACGQEESEGHVHTDACYEKQLTCGKEEHIHTDACYIDPDADVEDASLWDAQYEDVQWEEAWGANLVTAAAKQIGYKESTKNYTIAEDGSHKGYSRYGQFAGDVYADWDAAFVNFCIHYAGLEELQIFPNEVTTEQWHEKYVTAEEGRNKVYMTTPEGYEPEAGDIIFLKKENEETETQMGIVSSYDKEKNEIKVIEGNSGNEVKENKYSLEDSHISEYLMVTEMEKAYKNIPDVSGEEKAGEAADETEVKEDAQQEPENTTEEDVQQAGGEDAQAAKEEENWAYEESYDADKVVIQVKAGEGIVPEGAELSVTPIEKQEVTDEMSRKETKEAEAVNEQYELTEKKLQEESEKKGETLEGFLAYDISFLVDGEEVEPSGDVKVTMDFKEAVKPEGVSENATVVVNHLKEDKSAEDGVVVEDLTEKEDTTIATAEADVSVEKVELVADSFSSFTISWTTPAFSFPVTVENVKFVDEQGGELNVENGNIVLENKTTTNLKEKYNKALANQGYEVVQIMMIIPSVQEFGKYEEYEFDSLKTNDAEFELYQDGKLEPTYSSNVMDLNSGYYIQVKCKSKGGTWLAIEDTVDVNGLITVTGQYPAENVRFVWSKQVNDGEFEVLSPVRYGDETTISADGKSLNIPLDKGGLTKTRWKVIYKVELQSKEGTILAEAEYSVPYYSEVVNGSFEQPTIPDADFERLHQFPHDDVPGWRTTATSENVPWGIEIVRSTTENNYVFAGNLGYHDSVIKPDDGRQFAEINAEGDGALYQDVLTYKDIPLTYYFSHRGRRNSMANGMDSMYVVIIPKELAENGLDGNGDPIDTNTEVTDLMNKAKGDPDFKKENNVYVERYTYSGKWSSPDQWDHHSDTYTPTGCMTRFFFVSDQGKMPSYGNFIDNVSFTQDVPEATDGRFNLRVEKTVTGLSEEQFLALKENLVFDVAVKDSSDNYVQDANSELLTGGNVTLNASEMAYYPGANDSFVLYKDYLGNNIQGTYTVSVTERESTAEVTDYTNVPTYQTIVTSNGVDGTPQDTNTTAVSEEEIVTVKYTNAYTLKDTKPKAVKKISVIKIWEDFENYDTRKGLSIRLDLSGTYKDENGKTCSVTEEELEKWGIESKTINGSEEKPWQDEWTEVPVYYKNNENQPITWEVKETLIGDNSNLYEAKGGDTISRGGQPQLAQKETVNYEADEEHKITNSLTADAIHWSMVKYSTSNNNTEDRLEGAKFELRKDSLQGTVAATGDSIEDGIISWKQPNGTEGLSGLTGDYVIVETQAPEGFTLSSGDGKNSWDVKLVNGIPSIPKTYGNIRTDGPENGNLVIYIGNTALYSLPESGGSGIYWYMFGGILLMAGAALITYKKRCREVLKG